MTDTKPTTQKSAKATTNKKATAPKKPPVTTADQSSPIVDNTILPLTISWSTIEPVYQKTLRRFAKQVKLPGFRQGKTPLPLAMDAIGQTKLIEATLDVLLPAAYREALEKSGKQPLTQPDVKPISLELNQDWTLEIHIAERPEIKLGNYHPLVLAAKKEAAAEIKKLNDEAAKAIADQSKATPAATSQDAADDHDHAHHHHPHSHQPKPLTEKEQEDVQLRFIVGKLITELKPQIPELLVRQETRRDLEQLVQTLDQVKISVDDYLARRGYTFEQLSQELAGTALSKLQVEFMLSEIGVTEKITAEPADLDKHFAEISDTNIRAKQQANPDYQRYVSSVITRQKTLDFLLALK